MKRQALCFIVVLLILTMLISSDGICADPYYKGKTITIICGSPPGGGYDRMARLLGKHLPKHIPGSPTFVVQSMPGASHMIATNHMFNVAKPDGLTIATLNRGLIFAQLTKAEGVRFDLTKFSWVGSAAFSTTVLAVRGDLPYKTPEDLRKAKEPVNLGGTGRGDVGSQFIILMKDLLGFNVKSIVYPYTAEIILALERKELDGQCAAYDSIKPHIDRGLLRPVVRSKTPEPGIEYLPANEDLTTDKMAKTIMSMLSTADLVGRPYLAPPGVPAEIMKILRDAFKNVADDPELKADSKKVQMPVQYTPPEECLKTINYVFSQPQEIIKEFSKYATF